MVTELGSFSAGQILTATDLNDSATWTDYTPSFAGGVTVGNGTWAAGYAIVNKILFFQGTFTLGSTSAITGSVTLTVPDSRTLFLPNQKNLGNAYFRVGSTPSDYYGPVIQTSTTAVQISVYQTSGTYLDRTALSATVPLTWQSTNIMAISYCARID